MFGSKYSIRAIVVVLSLFTSVSVLASMQVIITPDFPTKPQTPTDQTQSVAAIKNCQNDEECKKLEVKNISK